MDAPPPIPESQAPRLTGAYQATARLIFNTLLLLLFLEVGAGLVLWVGRALFAPADPRLEHPYYLDKEWAETYWREFQAVNEQYYEPYVTWRRRPFDGETITIDAAGRRVTPENACQGTGSAPGAASSGYTVYLFGGSTAWGVGAPDWETIPAYLQEALAERLASEPVCVINFGEMAYVSTQGLLALEKALQAGAAPDLVLFYDGINDVYAAYQSGQAGAHQNLASVAATFEGRPGPVLRALLQSNIFRLLRNAAGLVVDGEGWTGPTYASRGVSAGDLATSVVATYAANYEMVAALADRFGFEYFFFWQPVLYIGEKPLAPDEAAAVAAVDPALAELFARSYPLAAELAIENDHMVYLGDIFATESDSIWIDPWHMIPPGNEQISDAIWVALQEGGVLAEAGLAGP